MKTLASRRAVFTSALGAAAAVIAFAASATGASPARGGDTPGFKTIMSFLDNPRGLAQGPDGAIYVTEAGHGGTGPCATMAGVNMCYGPTGAIARLKKYVVTRVATGLPSYAPASGNASTGPIGICFDSAGRSFVTYGLRASPSVRPMLSPGGAYSGYLMRMTKTGALAPVADITGYEAANNPAGDVVDSNPYGLACEANDQLVTDAGANFLVRVASGAISLLGTFPATDMTPVDTVPTAVAVGPDHAYYVGGLSGKPFPVGAAKVYRIVPGQAPQVYLSGLTAIIDLAFAHDGSLYVLEQASGPGLSGPGVLLEIAPSGVRTVVSDALDHPTALLIGRHGAIYVTNHGTIAGGGELLRLLGT
jgi:hypothetical protein